MDDKFDWNQMKIKRPSIERMRDEEQDEAEALAPQPEVVPMDRALVEENARLHAAMLVFGAYLLEKGETFRTGEGAELVDAYSAALTPAPDAPQPDTEQCGCGDKACLACFPAATQTAQEAVPVDLTYQQKLEALSLRFYQGMLWTPKAGDYYTTSRADLELYRVVAVEGGMVKTQYCDQSKSSAVSSWPEKEFTSEGFGPKRVWVPDFVLSAHPPQPSA